MTPKLTLILACLSGALSVGLGAFAAHGLRNKLDDYLLSVFQTGVQYQFYHSLALLMVGLAAINGVKTGWTAPLFLLGILFFSGSLYGLATTGQKWLGPITPLGGLCFIAGWLVFAWSIYRSQFVSH